MNAVAAGHGYEDVEGLAGVFLFRHYLELILKKIVINDRWLKTNDRNAVAEDVKKMANIHELSTLWKCVLQDAKPKFAGKDWNQYDTECV